MTIDTVHHPAHTEGKMILEESNTIEFIFKEDNCGKNGCIKHTQKQGVFGMEANFQDTFSEYLGRPRRTARLRKNPHVWTSIHLYGFFAKQAQLLRHVEVHSPVF